MAMDRATLVPMMRHGGAATNVDEDGKAKENELNWVAWNWKKKKKEKKKNSEYRNALQEVQRCISIVVNAAKSPVW